VAVVIDGAGRGSAGKGHCVAGVRRLARCDRVGELAAAALVDLMLLVGLVVPGDDVPDLRLKRRWRAVNIGNEARVRRTCNDRDGPRLSGHESLLSIGECLTRSVPTRLPLRIH